MESNFKQNYLNTNEKLKLVKILNIQNNQQTFI